MDTVVKRMATMKWPVWVIEAGDEDKPCSIVKEASPYGSEEEVKKLMDFAEEHAKRSGRATVVAFPVSWFRP